MVLHRSSVVCFAVILTVVLLPGCRNEQPQGIAPGGSPGENKFPSAAGVCKLPASGNCGDDNKCLPGQPCNVSLSVGSGQTVDVTLNGKLLTDVHRLVCVPQGASITWTAPASAAAHSSFLLDFGDAAPFTNTDLTYATGSDTQPVTGTTATANGCFKYNVKVCPIPPNASAGKLHCGQRDPKVIVGDGGS